MFHQPQNTNSLRDTGNNTTHMVLELQAEDVEVGTSANGNPRKYQVTMGRVSPGYADD